MKITEIDLNKPFRRKSWDLWIIPPSDNDLGVISAEDLKADDWENDVRVKYYRHEYEYITQTDDEFTTHKIEAIEGKITWKEFIDKKIDSEKFRLVKTSEIKVDE